jgi:hypothetical protein
VWCGVVWRGVVWCGVVWCGVVWCGVVWCGVVWSSVICRVCGAVCWLPSVPLSLFLCSLASSSDGTRATRGNKHSHSHVCRCVGVVVAVWRHSAADSVPSRSSPRRTVARGGRQQRACGSKQCMSSTRVCGVCGVCGVCAHIACLHSSNQSRLTAGGGDRSVARMRWRAPSLGALVGCRSRQRSSCGARQRA